MSATMAVCRGLRLMVLMPAMPYSSTPPSQATTNWQSKRCPAVGQHTGSMAKFGVAWLPRCNQAARVQGYGVMATLARAASTRSRLRAYAQANLRHCPSRAICLRWQNRAWPRSLIAHFDTVNRCWRCCHATDDAKIRKQTKGKGVQCRRADRFGICLRLGGLTRCIHQRDGMAVMGQHQRCDLTCQPAADNNNFLLITDHCSDLRAAR